MQVTAELLSQQVNYSPICLLRKSEIYKSYESAEFEFIQTLFCTELWTLYMKFVFFFVLCFLGLFFNEVMRFQAVQALTLSLAVSAFEVTALNGPIWSSYGRLVASSELLSANSVVTKFG